MGAAAHMTSFIQDLAEILQSSRRCVDDEERYVSSQAVSMLDGQLASQEDGGSCSVGATSSSRSTSFLRPVSQAGRCGQQTLGSRRKQRCSTFLRLLALALVLLVSQSEAASLASNALELEEDHESLLTRAKDLFTDAVHDAANAVKPAAKRLSKKVRILKVTESQIPSGGFTLALSLLHAGLD